MILLYWGSSAQAIVLRKPSNGDIWPAYSKQRIEWTSTNIDNIKIESSLDSGRTWKMEVSSYAASAGFYEWDVPNKTSDSCYIRISDVDDNTKSASNYSLTNPQPFKIPPPSITIDSLPINVYKGSVQPITWVSSGVKKLNIYLSVDNKASFIKIADTINANNFYYNWIVNVSSGSQCYIVINDASNNSLSDTLKQAFGLVNSPNINLNKFKGGAFDGHASSDNKTNSLKLLTLNAADSIYGSSEQKIKWSSRNVDLINIYFSSDNGVNWTTIVENISASAGQYSWKASATPTSKARIKIVSKSDTTLFSTSTNAFIIRPKELKFTGIDSTSNFYKGGVFPISWQSGGVNNVRVKLISNSKDSTLKDTIPAINEMYNWIIHPGTQNQSKLVITDLSDSTISDTTGTIVFKDIQLGNNAKYKGGSFDGHTSKANTISNIKLLYPVGGEVLSVQNNISIQWKSNNIDKIKLELSIDSGRTWTTLNSDISGTTNNFSWRTPNSPSQKCFIRISDATESSVFDTNDSIFSLQPKSLLITTDSSEFIKETAKTLEWLPKGVDTIRIKYKTKQTESYRTIKDSLSAKSEVYNWIVPENLGDSLWIKMEDLSDTTVNDEKTYFKKVKTLNKTISPTKYRGGKFDGHAQRSNINKLIIKKPEANEVLVGGSKYSITWSTVNLEDSVLIEFTIDSGKTWNTVARTIASTGVYEWTIPSSIQGKSTNPFEFNIIRGLSNDNIFESNNSTTTPINSFKCQIRAIDISAGNVVVGSTSNNFAIVASTKKLSDSIFFTPPKTMTIGDTSQTLIATSSSSRTVKFIIDSGLSKATITSGKLNAIKPGKVRIGAFLDTSSVYENIDTVFQIVCINPAKPAIIYTGKSALCANDTATLTAPDGFTQFAWSTLDSSNTIKVYRKDSITLKVGVDGCFSVASEALKFTKETIATPSITSGSATSFCSGGSVVLTSSAAKGNQWFKDGTIITGATNATFNATQSGNYTVIATNSSGCASVASAAITVTANAVPAVPTIGAGSATSFCIGGSVVLTSSAANGNQWFKDRTIITGATNGTYTATQSGNYTVVTTNTAGCASAASTATTVTVNALSATPTISAVSATSFCVGGSVVLTSSATSGNQWFKNGSIIVGATNATYTAIQSGNYTVTTTNNAGCTSPVSAATTVTVNTIPDKATITRSGADLVSSTINGNIWFKDSTQIAGATSNIYKPLVSGYYSVQVRINGCSGPISDPYFYLVTSVVNTNTSNESYKLFPNPAREKVFIDAGISNHKINYQIFDASGKRLLNNNFSKSITIDISKLKPGVYTILLTNTKTQKQESKQIIIQ